MADIVAIAPAAGLPDIALVQGIVPVAPLLADALGAIAALGPSPWGVYLDGSPVIVADTVLDLGYDKAYALSDYPIENGGFASYDKVEQPFEARVRFAAGGSAPARAALVESVEGVVGDLNLYDVVTPDKVYVSANLVREEYRRTQSDAGGSLLQIDVSLQEVRIVSGQASGATQDPASADQQNGGTVQGSAAQGGIGSDAVASGTASAYPVNTPLPATLGGGVGGLPVTQPSGGIGSA